MGIGDKVPGKQPPEEFKPSLRLIGPINEKYNPLRYLKMVFMLGVNIPENRVLRVIPPNEPNHSYSHR
jgi:hypothetical protein